ncbi:MAG: choice-of-anchor H family protein [Gammaproteobacteria bacterium]
MNTIRWTKRLVLLTGLMMLIPTLSVAGSADRLSRSSAGFETEREGQPRRPAATLEDYQTPVDVRKASPGGPQAAQMQAASCCAFRIYSASTRLFDDFDNDGFYTYLRVNFDIDTDYFDADVYVRLFMRGSNGNWVEFYQSGVFSINGSSASDDYEVETELVAGFPPDDYDVLIEVYDADYGDLVVEYGPLESSALSFLPLEDISFDSRLPAPTTISRGGGGGALGLELLIFGLLAGVTVWRRRPRPAPARTQPGSSPSR